MRTPILLTIMLLTATFAVAEPPSWEAVRTKQAPVIDGNLDDPCWQEQTLANDFRDPATGEAARAQTYFRALFDSAALYLAIVCEEPDMKALRANLTGHDDSLWTDDCVEVMIDPTNARKSYAHIIVNPNGAVYDAWLTSGGTSTDMDYEGGAQAAAEKSADSWQVEIRIPFSGLRFAGDAKTDWAFNVCREKKTSPPELSCWSPPMAHGFHHPESFGALTGLKVNFRPYSIALGVPRLEEPYFEDGKLAGKLLVPSENWTGRAIATSVKAIFLGEGDEATETDAYSFIPRGRGQMAVPVVVGKPGTVRLRLEVRRRPREELLHQSRHALNFDIQPVSIRFIRPAYRDTIYASLPAPEIVCRLRVNVPRKELRGCELRVSLNAGVTELAVRNVKRLLPRGEADVEFSSENMPVGEYVVKAQALKDDEVIAEGQRTLRKLKPQAHEVILDNDLRLLVDGRHFYPWGFMGASPDEKLSKAGINTIHSYTTWYVHRDKDLNAWLDDARRLGIKVVMSPFPGPVGFHGFRKQPALSDRDLDDIREYVSEYKSHPALLAWYMCDEPRGSVWRANLRKAYKVVAEADPHHPCVALDNSAAMLAKLDGVGDILWIDPYPGFARDGGPRRPLTIVPQAIEDLRTRLPDWRPIWVAPQAFSYAEWDKRREATERAPSFTELRCMNYLAILSGADGVIPFAWAYAQRHPSTLNGYMEGLAPEMAILRPVLLEGQEVERCRAFPLTLGADIRLRAWQYEGSLFIIAVNAKPEEARVRLLVPGLGSRRLKVLAERRYIESLKHVITDVLPAYGVHIYSDKRRLPSLLSLEQIERHIRNDEVAREASE